MAPFFLKQIKKKLKLLVVSFALLFPLFLLNAASSVQALGCGERCWYPETGQLDCDEGLSCAPGDPPESRVCWGSKCGGGPDPTPTNTPTPAPTNTPTPTPTPIPCAPVMFPPDYACNKTNEDDKTASAEWAWTLTPTEDPAQEYFFQVAFDRDFNNIDDTLLCIQAGQDICELYEGDQGRAIGPTNFFGNASVQNPETVRFARVKVKKSLRSCDTGGEWVWSNAVASLEDCRKPNPGDDGGPGTKPLDKFFCNSKGKPTDSSDTGEIFTAIGCLPTEDLQGFTKFSLTWGMGIGGGISFVLIVYGGFLFMTSQGNPEKVQAGKELITAAVGGLVYLLFAVFLFRLIGLDILKIPGL